MPNDGDRWDFPFAPWWWLFALLIVTIKFVALGFDPLPRIFMGDSGSYLWTALSGWIPPDRSFLYGFLIRWTALAAHSLTSLLVLQTFLSALTGIILVIIGRSLFLLPPRLACLLGLLCAIDPLEWVWERYLMTETISLFIYAAMLAFSFLYLQRRRLWQLALVQILGVMLISFRISYLLVVETSALLLPLLAFANEVTRRQDIPWMATARRLGLHLLVSVVLFLGLHQGYKQINGLLSNRGPAYIYSSGLSLLATWAPNLQPNDSPDPRLAAIIAKGSQFHLRDTRLRNAQLYSPNYLVNRWKAAEPDQRIADRVAKQTALHSLIHHPGGIVALGTRTFLSYFDWRGTHRQAKYDLGKGDWPRELTNTIATRLRLSPPRAAERQMHSTLQAYFLHAQIYYYVVLLSPLACLLLICLTWQASHILLFVHGGIILATNSFLAVTASVRYLQPLSFLTILIFGILINHLIQRYRASSEPVTL